MKVLITGGAGFIGSTLAHALVKRGDKAVVIDDFNDFYAPSLKRENIAGLSENPLFRLYEADIRDREKVFEVFRLAKPNVVCHLAARAGVRPSIENPLLYEDVNCMGTLNLLDGAKEFGVRNFVFASSSSVYGINSKVPFSEDDPITCPISPYATTKRAGELMCFTYSHLYALHATCLRFFTVYGERGRPDMAVAKFTRAIHDNRGIQIFGDGSAQRDFTYIGDIVNGLVNSIDRPFRYEIINLGGANTVTVKRLVEIIEERLRKKAKMEYLLPAPGDVPLTSADVGKAKRLIGFEPKVAIEEGVGRYVKWFLAREKKD